MEACSSSNEVHDQMDTSVDSISGGGAAARIKALDRLTASNLRKSQIINKVSDIVRELVENSLDASASVIQIYLEKYGKDKIEVRDNGHGLIPSNVSQIFQGGCTSKLNDSSNLSRGSYLGFKGEALNAICAAGNVTVISKLPKDAAATKYKFDFLGKVISENRMAHNGGTTISVENLFQNIRVRRQRLENAATGNNELKEIEGLLKGIAIVYPKCHISLYHNTTLIWSKASVQTVEQSLYAVFGHNIAKKLRKYGPIRVEMDSNHKKDENDVQRSVELYLPIKPVDMRSMSYTSNKMAMIFCNQKRVYIREFEKLIHRYITANVEKPQPADQRRFPISIVCIQTPSTEADFNLDMDKSKVLLVHKDKIYDVIECALMEFYGIDLKNCTEEAPAENVSSIQQKSIASTNNDQSILESSSFEASVEESVPAQAIRSVNVKMVERVQCGKNECNDNVIKDNVMGGNRNQVSNTLPDSVASILSTSSISDTSRQSTIKEFLQNIPSATSAFTESPTKKMNTEPVSVEFPSSKPNVDTLLIRNQSLTRLNASKKPGGAVANFEIAIDSEESEDDTVGTAVSNAVHNPRAADKPKQINNEITGVDKYKNWLDGRIVDKFGEVIENVVVVNDSPSSSIDKRSDLESERFRAALFGGSFSNSSNRSKSVRRVLEPSQLQANPNEPSFKRPRSDALDNCSPYAFPPMLNTPSPRMPVPRQTTLDSFNKWPTPQAVFSQTASKAVVGVRIPLTPNHSKGSAGPPISAVGAVKNTASKSLPLLEHQERNNCRQQQQASHATNKNNLTNRFDSSSIELISYPAKKLTPQIHRQIQGCSQLYSAQTHDSIGVFSPLNMIEYFPNESRECWSSAPCSTSAETGTLSLTVEDVTRMFQKFMVRTDINNAPVAGKIFHTLSKLPNLTQAIRR